MPYRFNPPEAAGLQDSPSPIHTSDTEETYENKLNFHITLKKDSITENRLLPLELREESIVKIIAEFLIKT